MVKVAERMDKVHGLLKVAKSHKLHITGALPEMCVCEMQSPNLYNSYMCNKIVCARVNSKGQHALEQYVRMYVCSLTKPHQHRSASEAVQSNVMQVPYE